MKRCIKCGSINNDDAKFCQVCGNSGFDGENPVPGIPRDGIVVTPEQYDISKNKIMAVLSYFGLLVLIPIFAAKDSKFARFHANQGLVLMITQAVVTALPVILAKIAANNAAITVSSLVTWILDIILFVFTIMGIVGAAGGKTKDLPLIGKIRILR